MRYSTTTWQYNNAHRGTDHHFRLNSFTVLGICPFACLRSGLKQIVCNKYCAGVTNSSCIKDRNTRGCAIAKNVRDWIMVQLDNAAGQVTHEHDRSASLFSMLMMKSRRTKCPRERLALGSTGLDCRGPCHRQTLEAPAIAPLMLELILLRTAASGASTSSIPVSAAAWTPAHTQGVGGVQASANAPVIARSTKALAGRPQAAAAVWRSGVTSMGGWAVWRLRPRRRRPTPAAAPTRPRAR